MFGYVQANSKLLTKEENKRYQSIYCGICKALEKRSGNISRITLTYDMVFLVLLLSSVYDNEKEIEKKFHCMLRPLGSKIYLNNIFTDYAADMNIALCYNNFIDDWNDDKNILSLSKSKLFRKQYERVYLNYPDKCAKIQKELEALYEIEDKKIYDIDAASNCFARLMEEIFVFREDEFSDYLRRIGFYMGKAIYYMDAVVDLRKDKKKNSYNPLILNKIDYDKFSEDITFILGEGVRAFEDMNLKKDYNILKNILYSGIWIRYDLEMLRIKNKELKQ